MLQLLHTPQWAPAGAAALPLPATLPACLLLYLAAQDGWVDRERMAVLFWPERPAADGLHNLRVNLHRTRGLTQGWGDDTVWRVERSRLRLDLPTDLLHLRQAIDAADCAALGRLAPSRWLQGFRIAGFEAFWDWADAERERWCEAWGHACERAVMGALARGAPDDALALFEAWQAAGGGAMPALAGLDPGQMAAPARAAWLHLCARSQPAPDGHAATASLSNARLLAGRGPEQDALRANGAAAVVLLGEPGVGKTSVLLACWPEAAVIHGREGLAGVPYAPVLEWLRRQRPRLEALLVPTSGSPAPLRPYRLDLARLLPELAPDEPLPPLDALTAKARLLEALARVFEAQGPVLLVDDLQWCDAATLEWLVFVAHRGRQRWRATARRHELAGPARRMLDSLQAAHLLGEQPLDGLGRQALGEVCRQRWPGRDWSEAALDGLHRLCAGNPFVLSEMVAIGADAPAALGQAPALPRKVRELVGRRLQALSAAAREVLEAAAVLTRPAPISLLAALCDGGDEAPVWRGCEEALAAELLSADDGGLQCRHDLIRSTTLAELGAARRQWLNRRAALMLAAQPQPEPLLVAGHWEAAGEPQTALAWMHRAAQQQKDRGHFDDARWLWQRVSDESLDATQALRARLALAECDLLHDLARGRLALQAVLDEAGAVADALQRDQIEGQALAGLIDNAVFSGATARAVALAPRLRELLPRLRTEERVHACEVLIELAMREPDIPAAHALIGQLHRLAPRRPSTLHFEAQTHWFAGDAQAAHDAMQALLAAHPDYCSGLTIENDLAVMLHALGELSRAEAMARRSLQSWKGVAHTETLSLLVLGSVLTGLGRHADALAALDQALRLGREQSSALFEAEALVRRARLWLQCGRVAQARADLDAAELLLRDSADPLRVSQYAVARVVCQAAAGEAPERALADRLRQISLRSVHPLLHARLARIEVALAWADGEPAAARQAAGRVVAITRAAGLLEPLAEGLLLLARAIEQDPAATEPAAPLAHEAAALSDAQGFADMAWRARAWLAQAGGSRALQAAVRDARQRLEGELRPALFDARLAAQREPWPPRR